MTNLQIQPDTVLKKPRITEKAAILAEKENVYVFEVSKDATSKSVAGSLKEAYKVTPINVRFAAIPRKKIFFRGKWGNKGGGKKAYIKLKKGDKIDII